MYNKAMKAILVKSFTQNRDEGNPAGVVLNANALSDEKILAITRDLGFGESAFLQSPANDADYLLRLFSVEGEVNSCATATIAAAYILFSDILKSKEHITFQTKLGNIKVFKKHDGSIFIGLPPVQFIPSLVEIHRDEIAKLLAIDENKIADFPIEIASIGTPKLLIPIKTLEDLFAIKPNLDAIAEYCKKSGARGFYPFTLETKKAKSDFHTRQFNPLAGIAEDPVTGVAAGALAGYLKKYKILDKEKYIGEQGYVINSPGEIVVRTTKNTTYVGGFAVMYGEKDLKES
jgi:PhzF family phenazine biosynthesis protein